MQGECMLGYFYGQYFKMTESLALFLSCRFSKNYAPVASFDHFLITQYMPISFYLTKRPIIDINSTKKQIL